MLKTFLSARWKNLIMANYAIDPAILKPYLPAGVELDFFEDRTYVSLVGFLFQDTRLFGMPIPLLGSFEEVNLRFYVKRTLGTELRRGVVFINETVPYAAVAWLANALYKEHYVAIPTQHSILQTTGSLNVTYRWKKNQQWNHMAVQANPLPEPMVEGGPEEFIFEHYFGYTRLDQLSTQEYRVNHPRWRTHSLASFELDCDFSSMYGPDFAFLTFQKPDSVFLAEGSDVTVDWKRSRI
jgi:uncharacterized protein